jgi:hypothetical protein
MSNLLGFYSYVHADDENDGGRVIQLGRDIVGELKAISGDDDLELFLDRDGLHQGDQWREKVDDALSNVSFFIPILTPRFFNRVECRREFQFFADQAELLGISEIILPILYIDFPELHNPDSSDPLVRLVQRVQWLSWLDVRSEGRLSSTYRKGIQGLAQELDRRRKMVESTDIIPAAALFEQNISLKFEAQTKAIAERAQLQQDASTEDENGEELGTLEILGAMEEASPRLTETLGGITLEIETFNEIISQATLDFEKGNKEGKGFAWRLLIARRLATDITEPINRMEALGRKYLADLHEIDTGFRVLLPRLVEEAKEDSDTLTVVINYFKAVREMYEASRSSKDSLLGMVESFRPIEKLSKDLRAPLRKMRTTFISMSEAQAVIQEWMTMVEATGIEYLGTEGATS